MRNNDIPEVGAAFDLKRRVGIARTMVGLCCGVALAVGLVALSGCATAPQGYQTLVPSPYERSQDLNQQDDNLDAVCQEWSIQVVASEVKAMLAEGVNPEDITEQMVIDSIGRAYDHCIRVNGRQAQAEAPRTQG